MADIIKKIENEYKNFSKSQKLIANFVKNHYEKAAYMTASKLGNAIGISESTVVRFATEIGFDGYPSFQKELLEWTKTKLTTVQRMQVTKERIPKENMLKNVLSHDIELIRETLGEIDKYEFKTVVDKLVSANKIYILGVRSSAALANFMGFYFNLMFDNVKVISSSSSSEVLEQVIRAKSGDVVIGISFPRYSQRAIKMMEYAKKQGATTVALTDSKNSPVSENADYTLVAKSDMASFADSLVAPLSVINAVISAVAQTKENEITDTLESLENIWTEQQTYKKMTGEI